MVTGMLRRSAETYKWRQALAEWAPDLIVSENGAVITRPLHAPPTQHKALDTWMQRGQDQRQWMSQADTLRWVTRLASVPKLVSQCADSSVGPGCGLGARGTSEARSRTHHLLARGFR